MNSGNRNTGDWNSGDWNSGNRNSGNRNSGDWNSCNMETGFFNSIESDTIRVFNKPCSREDWHKAEKPLFFYFSFHETTGGYLKTYQYQEAFQKAWNETNQEDRDKIFNLPNFDADVFYEISGIDVREVTSK